MINRIFLVMYKLKVLSLLLILFLIFSMTCMIISFNYTYKFQIHEKKVEDLQNYVLYAQCNIESFACDESSLYYSKYLNELAKQDNVKQVYTTNLNLYVSEMSIYDPVYTSMKLEGDSESSAVYDDAFNGPVAPYFGEKDYINNFIDNLPKISGNEIIISRSTANTLGLIDGDQVSLYYAYSLPVSGVGYETSEVLNTYKVAYIFEDITDEAIVNTFYNINSQIYLASDEFFTYKTDDFSTQYSNNYVFADNNDLDSITSQITDEITSSNLNSSNKQESTITNTYEEQAAAVDNYQYISTFFFVMSIVSFILFIVVFASINNSIITRRFNEYKLYYVFGQTRVSLLLEAVLEKFIYIFIALIFVVFASYRIINSVNVIIDNLLKYAFTQGKLDIFAYSGTSFPNTFSSQNVVNSFTEINSNSTMIFTIVFTILLVLITSATITILQFSANANKIKNQVRGN